MGCFAGALPDSNETVCVLNHQRRPTLPRPTAAPTATRLRQLLTLPVLWRQALTQYLKSPNMEDLRDAVLT